MSIVRLSNIYIILEHLEKRPAMYLGPEFDISKLNTLFTGFMLGRGKMYTPALDYPNFGYFGSWLSGVLKTNDTTSWSWILLQKYKDEKIAFQKFFTHLNKFKAADVELTVVTVPKRNVERVLADGHAFSKMQKRAIRRLNKFVVFKFTGSPTVFCLLVDANGKAVYEERSGKIDDIVEGITEIYGVQVAPINEARLREGMKILEKNKVISAKHKYSALVV